MNNLTFSDKDTFRKHLNFLEEINNPLKTSEEPGFTYLHCTHFASPKYDRGWWVCIKKKTYLTFGSERIKMLHAINIPVSPEKHYFENFGDSLKFTLIFPAVPKYWETFNLYESNGFYVNGISRNNTGIYKLVVS